MFSENVIGPKSLITSLKFPVLPQIIAKLLIVKLTFRDKKVHSKSHLSIKSLTQEEKGQIEMLIVF